MIKKYDFQHYQELIVSFDYELDAYNPSTEAIKEYAEILEKFDPINAPPGPEQKKPYILNYIVPILLEFAKDFKAQVIIEELDDSVSIKLMTKEIIIIIYENFELFKNILYYATSFIMKSENDKIKLELYFRIK
ncbi:hypothetical protein [[Clostridium] symbiosum]|uniref:hypothetical protein n=1 Tax=Clostridium symbiosum TaxID=1512 RepID=UPI00321BC7B9